jgi:hypothetical protein
MPVRFSPGDFPANPLEKPGYRLEFHDEFDGPTLDTEKWVPYYLPQWSSRARSAPRYAFEQGNLVLQITQDQQPWCPEFDGDIRCSSIQTGLFSGPVGSSAGQHRFNRVCVVREAQPNLRTYTPQYGFFELRAKGVNTETNHVAAWMIGFEDAPERSGEIAIFEIMGAYVSPTSSSVGYGAHPWADPNLKDEFHDEALEIDATRFHIYAVEWMATQIDFYVDNVKIRTIGQSPAYPMQFMLSIYERPAMAASTRSHESGPAYPREFTIDYFRAYQPERGYEEVQLTQAADALG